MKQTTTIAAALMLSLLSACGGKDAAEHYSDAQKYIEQQKHSAAIIELKSAIQQAPENMQYRLTLGNLYLESGNAVFAQKELLKAKEAGATPEQVALNLVRASYLSGQHEEVLALYTEDDTSLPEPLNSYLQTFRALSELELGAADEGLTLFSELAMSEQPDIVNFAQSNILIPAGQYQDAVDKLATIPSSSPIYQETLYLSANLYLILQQYDKANTLLTEFLTAQPHNLRAHLLATQANLKQEKLSEAATHADLVLNSFPDHAYANYLKAIIEFESKNYIAAKEHVEKAINNGYRPALARIIAALSSYELGQESQALFHLTTIENQLDAFPDAKKMYIGLQLKTGNATDAGALLQDTDFTAKDLRLVATTAFNLAKQGSTDVANELISKYENAGYDDLESLTTLGALKLSIKGQEDAGIHDLELALQMDPSQHKTRLILASRYLRKQEYSKVDAIVEEWLKSPETAIAAYNLKAYSAVLQQKTSAAEESIKQALAIDADNALANLLQATVMAYNKEYEQADVVLTALLKLHPNYMPAITQLFYVSRQLNKEAEAVKYAESVLQKSAKNYPLRIFLARYHYLNGRFEETIKLLSGIDTAQKLPPAHWIMLADSYLKQNNSREAIRTGQKWLQQNPDDIRAALTYVEILRKLNKHVEAIDVIEQQLYRQPKHELLTLTKLKLLIENNQFDNALDLANKLPSGLSNRPDVLLLKGKIQLNNGQRSAALNDFLKSYEAEPEHASAMIIADTYAKDYSLRQGVEFIESHIKEHGGSDSVYAFYATLLINTDASRAAVIYQQMLSKSPDNIILLNNYAWLLLKNNKPEEALSYAEKALQHAADNANVNDTYGAILVKINRASDAIPYFKKALSLEPNYDEAKLNYAEALILTNNKPQAAELLQSVSSDDPLLTQRKISLTQKL
jgi:cellulose synthase operon protein C